MASVETFKKGDTLRYRIRLADSEHANRPRISFGSITKRQADTVRLHIEQLVAAKKTSTAIPPHTVLAL
jgi:hypothetical protein